MKGLKKLQKLFKQRYKKEPKPRPKKELKEQAYPEECESVKKSILMNFPNMSIPGFSRKRKNEEQGKDTETSANAKKPKVIIYECIFRECSKRFHQNISSFKMHFVNLHVKKEIEKCIIHYQDEQNLPDRRQCPFEPCGYFAPFW